ncbi:hypothetical protein M8C21_030863, partial [Ambrosia artemisiifolia]
PRIALPISSRNWVTDPSSPFTSRVTLTQPSFTASVTITQSPFSTPVTVTQPSFSALYLTQRFFSADYQAEDAHVARIFSGEEITYNYKFPLEDNKIPCNCGSR